MNMRKMFALAAEGIAIITATSMFSKDACIQ